MAKKAKAKKKDTAKDWEEKWAQIEAALAALWRNADEKKAAVNISHDPKAAPTWQVTVSTEEVAKEPEWEYRIVCEECGQHRPWRKSPVPPGAIRAFAASLPTVRTLRRMRKVNGEWETHPLDDPALEKKIRDVAEKLLRTHDDVIRILNSHIACEHAPRWWQFWRH